MNEAAEWPEGEVEIDGERCGERNDREQQQRGNERQRRRQEEQAPARLGRKGLFLENVLHPVGGGLEQAGPADAIRPAPVLHPGADLALHEREERDSDHGDGEDEEHLDHAEQQKALELRRHRAASAAAPAGSTRPVNPSSE